MPPSTAEQTIPKDKDYVLRPQNSEERDRAEAFDDIPEYRVQLILTEGQEDRLVTDFFLEFDALKNERAELKLEDKWKEADGQYDGTVANNDRLMFNLHVHQSKVKVNAIARAIAKAFLESGEIADISPRPEMAETKNGYEVAEKQSEFIDYVFDEEIKPENDLRKIATEAAKKFVAIGKVNWAYRREKRKRYETYQGKNEPIEIAPGRYALKNEALENFLSTYPDAKDRYKGTLRKLVEEKQINIVVDYKDTINNNAQLKFIKIENFYVRNGCEYWEGLRTEHCVVERQSYTYWELLKKEKDGEFQNVDKLWDDDSNTDKTKDKTPAGNAEDYKTKSYDVLEGTYYWKLNENDDEEIKIKCWFGEHNKTFLGATLFPYYALDIDYIPFYLILNQYGFYGDCKSVMWDLRDSNIAQDALFSLMLHGMYSRTIMTPIVKEGSEVERMLIEKDWVEGMPLAVDELSQDVSKELGFVQWPQMQVQEMMGTIGFAQRMDGNVTGVSDAAATGQNDPTDPHAPAHKTFALLQASGINIDEYIMCFLPSFNMFVTNVLQLYYQMSQEDRKYRVRRKSNEVTGSNPFASITRDEMIAKTNVQSRAAGFVFEKAQERADAMAALEAVTTNPYTARIPEVQFKALGIYLNTFGQRWRNFVSTDLPSPQALDKMLQDSVTKAIVQFMQAAAAQQATTGVRPNIGPDQLKGVAENAKIEAYNPAVAEAAKGNK